MKELMLFKALADETRLKIVHVLLEGEKCVCEIVPCTKRTQSTVSIQLAKLEKLGIVKSRRESRRTYYKIANPKIKKILSKVDFSTWKGIKREKIEWFPVIDEDKCIGCGMCVTSCVREVFGFNYKRNKAFVKNPDNCLVGCTACGAYCPEEAISFSNNSEYVKKIIQENNLLGKAKQELTNYLRRRKDG